MCMEDVRLGRDLAADVRQLTVPNSSTQPIIGPDPNRTRIVISTDGVQLVHIWPRGISPAGSTGFALTIGSPQMTITVEEWGKLVQGAWFAEDGVNGSTLTIALMTLEKQ